MTFHIYPSPPNLSEYVRCFWVLESHETRNFPFVHRATAECCPELIFYFKGEVNLYNPQSTPEKTFTSGLYAQSEAFRKFTINKAFGMVGVYFYPYAFPLLFNIPANNLSGLNIDITSLLGEDGTILENKIMCAPSHHTRIQLISDFLTKRLPQPQKKYSYLTSSIRQAITTGHIDSVTEMASVCNLSVRQIERDFKSLSGFSPRLFSKLTRFRSLMENLSSKAYSMTDLAYEFNYYDQSHFINEFKRFTGLSPTQYIRDRLLVENERMTPETVDQR